MPFQKTSGDTLASEKRRSLAMKYRIDGYTYKDIVAKLKEDLGDELPASYDQRYCWRDINGSIQKYREEIKETVGDLIHLETQRLDELFTIAMESAREGSMKGVLTALKIMERRAKLLGLNAPEQVVLRDWRDEILDLLKAERITIDQVRAELSDGMFQSLLEYKGLPAPLKDEEIEFIDSKIIEKEEAEVL
jgi:hypothetical protein